MILPNKFILIEGIDGSGKTQFVKFLEKEIKRVYNRSNRRSLSIFGQPSYNLKKYIYVKNIIEFGKVSGNIKVDINKFKQNRIMHEKYIVSHFKGLKICVRGVLTDIGTIYCKYNKLLHHSNLGQNIKIDLLIIIDNPILKSLHRIKKREKKQWRENYKCLSKFRKVYLNKKIIKNLKPKKF